MFATGYRKSRLACKLRRCMRLKSALIALASVVGFVWSGMVVPAPVHAASSSAGVPGPRHVTKAEILAAGASHWKPAALGAGHVTRRTARLQASSASTPGGGAAPATQQHASSQPFTTVPPAPSELSGFQGTSQLSAITSFGTDQKVAPPDPNLAVGPNDVLEATNQALFVFSRNGTLESSVDLEALLNAPAGFVTTDPRVVFDPVTQRFYLSVLVIEPLGTTNFVVLLASPPGSAVGNWNGFQLNNVAPNCTLAGCDRSQPPVADQPALGFSDNLVTVTWNYFNGDLSTSPFYGNQADFVQKSDLVSNVLTTNTVAPFFGGPFGAQPVVSLSSTATQYVVYNNSDPVIHGSTPSIGVVPVSGQPEQQNVMLGTEADPGITPTSTQTDGSVLPAPQAGTAVTLDTGDDRLLNATWQNGLIDTTGDTDCTPSGDATLRACLNVVGIAADSGGNVGGAVQLPFVGVAGEYLFYPSISIDSSGTHNILTFDESSSSSDESVQVAGVSGGGITAFTTLHTSSTFFNPGAGSCAAGVCRWGDYSGTAQDPSHPNDVWVVSEDTDGNNSGQCTTSQQCWNTYIGRYTYAMPSITRITPAAGPTGGGQTVTVTGSDFLSGSTATLGGASAAVSNVTPDSLQITTPAHVAGLTYAQVTDSLGPSATNSPPEGYVYTSLGSYVPLTPFRILDTRTGLCGVNICSALGAAQTLTLQLTGYTDPATSESIPASATAVVINVTAVNDPSFSLLTAYPNGTAQPLAANVNFNARTNTANLVTAVLGQSSPSDANREVEITNALGTVNVVADVEGYFAPQTASSPQGEFHPIAPTRVCDTRAGQPTNPCNNGFSTDNTLGPSQVMKIPVAGVGTSPNIIPGDGTAEAAVLNLAAVSGTSNTFLAVYPTDAGGSCGTTAPTTATINVEALTNQDNRVIVPLGPSASGAHPTSLCVFNSLGTINIVLDANGWFGSGAGGTPLGSQYQPIGPSRICDTRSGSGQPCAGSTLGPAQTITVAVAGVNGIPTSGSAHPPVAIVANAAAVAGTQPTFLTVFPADVSLPNSADINVNAAENLSGLLVTKLATSSNAGDVDVYNSLGSIDVVIDAEGWFQ